MRFMVLRKADGQTEAGVLPTTEQLEDMGRYMEQLAQAGVLLGGEGLQPSSRGARVRFSAGKPTVTDGPFAETKEVIAGYMLIQAGSWDEALDIVKRWPEAEVELEVRQLFENDDFGEAFTPEQREREDRLRAELAAEA
jgi:hypothetical protein